jgi:tetratricopeptide (TPR) repeat protein/transglutaminase-like putative cysteine protease
VLAVVATACAVVPAAPGVARAGVEAHLSRIAKQRAEVDSLPVAERYAALRRLWLEWDQGDPAQVEEALREVAESPTQPPPIQVYAKLLGAYGRRRRGDVDGARKAIAELGYVTAFEVAGSFDNEGKTGLARTYEPEVDGPLPEAGKTYDGKERRVSWRRSQAFAPFGWVDTGELVRPTENVCVYASTWLRDKKLGAGQSRTVTLWAGSAGAMRVWFDGTVALEDAKYRDYDAERHAATVTLRGGWARVLVKVCGDGTAPIFALRVGDARGAPDRSIEVSVRPDGVDAARKPAPKAAGAIKGPLAMLEDAAKGGDPARLEALARYLVLTQSDDPADRAAREAATKAAKAAPTIRRLLLASALAEDRNQTDEWISKAEALARKPGVSSEDRVSVLLARAGHARTSLNWRDAMPFYESALAIDPDDVTAGLARAELYSEAGMHQTALGVLQSALQRRPKSVALVRALSSTLRQLGRITEADEAEERYAALRFDDAVFLRNRVELAIARRDKADAGRWLDRLLSIAPDDGERLGEVAHYQTQIGERTRAIATYKRALDLAPEDVETMKALADLYAMGGQRSEQVALLRRVMELRPQSKDVRDYLASLEPEKPRPDETWARPSSEFLASSKAPAGGRTRRTLVNLSVATVFPNGLASRFSQVVMQPLTERAATEARTYSFAYQADSEVVQLRGARVYHADGRVEEVADYGESDADDPRIAMYTSTRVFTVRFPRLSPGDVTELRYRVEDVSAHNAFADYFGDVSYLQSSDPIARAEYVLVTPKSRSFYFNSPSLVGGGKVEQSVSEQGDTRTYHWLAKDVPAVEPEPSMPPMSEFLGHVHVSTYKSWDDVGRWYWGLVKDQFTADDEVRRRVAEVTKGLTDDKAKVRAIYSYVVQKTRYVALEFGIHGFKPYRCAQIFARGFGDCKDKATLIVTMLREANIPATIVVVRTGMRGLFETDPASLAPFDHAIAYVPSMDLYLDGTAEYTGSTELPAMDRGAMALQINEGKAKLVHLPDPPASESVASRRTEATLAPDGSAQLDWRSDIRGVAAPAWRQRYHAAASRKQRLSEDLGSDMGGVEIGQIEASELEDPEKPVWLKAKGKASQLARRDGDGFAVSTGPRDYLVREYASLGSRKLDLRLSARTTQETEWVLHLPPGAKATSVPAPVRVQSPFGSVSIEVEQAAGTIRVRTKVVLDRSRIAPAEYDAFRAFCEKGDRALGQRVIYTR